jgi:hypothetical protein
VDSKRSKGGFLCHSPARHVDADRSVCASVIICLALIQVLLARGALVAASTFTLVRRHALAAVEAVRIADRHAVSSVASVARLASTVVGALGVGADRVLVARVRVPRALIDLHAVPLVGLRVAAEAFAFVRPVCVHTSGIHITVMSVLAAPLETLVSICEERVSKRTEC